MVVPRTEITVAIGERILAQQVLEPGEYTVGGDASCEIVIKAGAVHERHAKLTVNYGELLIEDLGSGAGTLVNGERVTEAVRLWPGQAVRLGEATLTARRLRSTDEGESIMPQTAELRRHLPQELRHDGRYVINKLVAQGGMGAILDARDQTIRRTVAMKVMLDPRFGDDVARFIQEAQVTGQLEHPNIVPIYELGIDEHQQVFYTMKFVRGVTLRKVLELLAAADEPTIKKYSLAALLTIFQKICDAVAFAHSRGVIHRDLKPENVMIGEFGEVLVMDWGLAKRREWETEGRGTGNSEDITSAALQQTLLGSVVGTPHYMAPEQAEGRLEEIDERTDVFALGGVLYSILTLREPFEGETTEEILRNVTEGRLTAPAALSGAGPLRGGRVPEALSAVAMHALAGRRDERYPTVLAVQTEIAAFQSGFATSAERAGLMRQAGLLIQRHRRVFATAAVAGVVIVALTIWSFLKVTASERQAERQQALAEVERDRAEATLVRLRETAPTFYGQARALVGERNFKDALRTVDYAISLEPQRASYIALRGAILQSLLRFPEARTAFESAVRVEPGLPFARANAALCEELTRQISAEGKLNEEGAEKLYEALLAQGRLAESVAVVTPLRQHGPAARKALAFWQGKLAAAGANPNCLKLYDGYRLAADLKGREVMDLRLLRDVPLVMLSFDWTNVSDLSPLRGMPLEELNLNGTPVRDLTPLQGMKLRVFLADKSAIADLSPLRGMPLRRVSLAGTGVSDFSPLAGAPLEQFETSRTPLPDLSFLRDAPLTSFTASRCLLGDLSPLAGRALTIFRAQAGAFTSLEPLRGMPIRVLEIPHTRVADLSMLEEMPLVEADLDSLPVTDLNFLRGKALTRLALANTAVRSLEPLRGMPLRSLDLRNCRQLTDLSPLEDCSQLEALLLPPGVRDLAFLRSRMNLRRLSYDAELSEAKGPRQTAAEFWAEYDAKEAR